MQNDKWESLPGCMANSVWPSNRRAAALLIMTAVVMVAIAIAAYAINVAHIQYTRAEMQIVTDVSTRAACRALVDTGSQSQAYLAAQRLADANKVAGRKLTIAAGDLQFSAATRTTATDMYAYAATATSPNSVRFNNTFFQRSREALPMLMPSYSMATGFRPIKEATAAQADLDIAIVLDCSSSMLAPWNQTAGPEGLLVLPLPVPPTARWQIARAGIQEALANFRNSPPQERVAFTTFNNVSLLNLPLSSDYMAVESALAFHSTAYLGGLSSLADGMNSAMTMLSNPITARAWSSRVLLVVSDGNENFGAGAMNMARKASQSNIMVYTVSVGSDANKRLMSDLAAAAHGRYLHADTPAQFVQVVEEVNRHLPVLITR